MDVMIWALVGILSGLSIGVIVTRTLFPRKLKEDEEVELASTRAQKIVLKAKEEAHRIVTQANKNALAKEKALDEIERRLSNKHRSLEQKSSELDKREDELDKLKLSLEQAKRDLRAVREKLREKLEKIAGMSRDEARQHVIKEVERDLVEEKATKIKQAKEEIGKKVDEIAKEMIIDAMQTAVTDYGGEISTTTVPIENEEIKGRIIGRDGRNIKAFEKLTGAEIVIDESPEYVTISCFDPIRREIARLALERLIADGRIHPGRIEEFVTKAKRQVAKEIIKAGEDLAFKAGFPNLPLKIIKYLGKYKYRFSYGQNLATHTLEVVKICGRLAGELGLNIQLAKKCALFHDLGKVAPSEEEGGHPELGVELGKRLGLEEPVLNAMLAHHGKADPITFESALTIIGDALSGSRPGARRISAELYFKRIKELENVAKQFEGVKEAYAIYAGRELRIFVNPEQVDDTTAAILSHEIAKKIQETQTYPGTVQVTIIRETRAIDVAK